MINQVSLVADNFCKVPGEDGMFQATDCPECGFSEPRVTSGPFGLREATGWARGALPTQGHGQWQQVMG